MSIKDRIKLVRKENNLSQTEFANKLGITQSVVSLIESGNSSVSVETLSKMSQIFDLSCDWLIYGKSRYARLSHTRDFIPLVNIEVKAGYITNHIDPDYLENLELYKIPGFEKGDYRIFEVEGDSMLPTILPHDKIICSKAENIKEIVEGSLCVIVATRDIVVKRLYYSHKKADSVILKSDNSNFKNLEVPLDEIHEVWLVQAKITSSFASNSYEQTQRLDELEKELKAIKKHLSELLIKFNGGLGN